MVIKDYTPALAPKCKMCNMPLTWRWTGANRKWICSNRGCTNCEPLKEGKMDKTEEVKTILGKSLGATEMAKEICQLFEPIDEAETRRGLIGGKGHAERQNR